MCSNVITLIDIQCTVSIKFGLTVVGHETAGKILYQRTIAFSTHRRKDCLLIHIFLALRVPLSSIKSLTVA